MSKAKNITARMWLYFLIITALLFVFFWLLQMVFLGGFYTMRKTKQLSQLGGKIEYELETKSIEDNSFKEFVYNEGVDVKILDGYGRVIASTSELISYPQESPVESFHELYNECVKKVNASSKKRVCYKTALKSFDAYVYGSEIYYGGEELYLFVSCPVAQADSGREIAVMQLLIITIIISVFSVLVSWLFSKRFSRPIVEMSAAARKLAKGDYSVKFEGNSYNEVNELAETLNYVCDELANTDKLRKDVMANVSHDLKTPLTMIRAYAEMIRDISGNNKEKRERHTQVIIEESERLTKLVNDMLNLSKLQSGVEPMEKKKFDLSLLTLSIVERFGIYSEKEGYSFEKEIDSDVFVEGDERKIEQAVYNLVGNAVNYTGDDKKVKVKLKKSKNTALLEIIDTGKGIPEEQLNTIWDRYYRLSESHERPVKGSGLGLSIVKAILLNHDLNFGVKSKVGAGSDFWIEFRCVKNDDEVE